MANNLTRAGWEQNNRKKLNTGEPPNADDIFFYGYKEPLRKFEGGFGYLGVLSYNKAQDKVQCHFCGHMFRVLGTHLHFYHNMTAREYKFKTGLMQKTALIAESTRVKMTLNSNFRRMTDEQREKRKKGAMVALRKRIAEGRTSRRKIALEHHNLRGSCPDQLLEKIGKMSKTLGRAPAAQEFMKEYGVGFYGAVINTFGKWSTAIKKLNMRPVRDIPTDAELLDGMTNFYKVNGRTPRFSDFRRGLLYPPNIYARRFGTMNRARLLANVPFLTHVGRTSQEWLPTTAEREKMLAREDLRDHAFQGT